MDVLLKKSMEKLGRIGDIVSVRDGFARNYLLPTGRAALVNKANLDSIEHDRAAALVEDQVGWREELVFSQGVERYFFATHKIMIKERSGQLPTTPAVAGTLGCLIMQGRHELRQLRERLVGAEGFRLGMGAVDPFLNRDVEAVAPQG